MWSGCSFHHLTPSFYAYVALKQLPNFFRVRYKYKLILVKYILISESCAILCQNMVVSVTKCNNLESVFCTPLPSTSLSESRVLLEALWGQCKWCVTIAILLDFCPLKGTQSVRFEDIKQPFPH